MVKSIANTPNSNTIEYNAVIKIFKNTSIHNTHSSLFFLFNHWSNKKNAINKNIQ